MNYAAHYARLITRARGRTLSGYSERHHVLPRCLGGTNAAENIVRLTGPEHYVAHQLLVKLHPERAGLALAAARMAKQCVNNKAYGWLRERWAASLRGVKLPAAQVERIRERMLGRKHTSETKLKMSIAHRGREQSESEIHGLRRACAASADLRRGKPLSPEHRAKVGRKGRVVSAETRRKLAIAVAGHNRKHTPETKAKMSATRTGRKRQPFSAEWREKLRLAKLGNKNRLGGFRYVQSLKQSTSA